MKKIIVILLWFYPSVSIALSNSEIIDEQSANALLDADVSPRDQLKCLKLKNQIQKPLQEMYEAANFTSPKQMHIRSQLILKLTDKHCSQSKWYAKTMRVLLSWLKSGSKKVVVFLPLTGPYKNLAQSALAGIRQGMGAQGYHFDEHSVVFDTRGQIADLKQSFARAILQHRPDMVIGGITNDEAKFLSAVATPLRLPTVLLRNSRETHNQSPFVFKVFPNQRGLAIALAQSLKSRRIQKVAILAPQKRHGGLFVQSFRTQIQKLGLEVTKDLSYIDHHFDMLDLSIKELLNLDKEKRKEEYEELLEAKRLEAEEQNITFNEKKVLLPPQVEFDALFIPDNFRNVRHIMRLLKFHGVTKKIVFVGDQQWRSPSLLKPFDPYLEGALFADYIGFYDDLPPGIKVAPTPEASQAEKTKPKTAQKDKGPKTMSQQDMIAAKTFMNPETAQLTDFKLIGYRAGHMAEFAVTHKFLSRRRLAKSLRRHKFRPQKFFASGPGFDQEGLSYWPAFVFQIKRRQITLSAKFGPAKERFLSH